MKRTTISLILLIVCLGVFAQTSNKKQVSDHYITPKFDVAIFPANSLDLIPGKRFTPTKKEIEIAEAALENQLEKLNKPLVNQHNSPIVHKKLRKFRRQYFGYIDESGNRTLLINSFWKKGDHADWLNAQVMVSDGGSYYWSVKFDLTTSKLYDLYINGSG